MSAGHQAITDREIAAGATCAAEAAVQEYAAVRRLREEKEVAAKRLTDAVMQYARAKAKLCTVEIEVTWCAKQVADLMLAREQEPTK